MRIATRKVQVLYLSRAEVDTFATMLTEASEGKTVHYSERQVGPGAHIGVLVDDEQADPRLAAQEREINRQMEYAATHDGKLPRPSKF